MSFWDKIKTAAAHHETKGVVNREARKALQGKKVCQDSVYEQMWQVHGGSHEKAERTYAAVMAAAKAQAAVYAAVERESVREVER